MTTSNKFGAIERVIIDIIPHKDQRYETCGDWYREDANEGDRWGAGVTSKSKTILRIRASMIPDDPNNFFALAVAYHELGEALGCIANGIDEQEVDQFDVNFRGRGEPGDDPLAPYARWHAMATVCELILIDMMGKSASVYERALTRLPKIRRRKRAKEIS